MCGQAVDAVGRGRWLLSAPIYTRSFWKGSSASSRILASDATLSPSRSRFDEASDGGCSSDRWHAPVDCSIDRIE